MSVSLDLVGSDAVMKAIAEASDNVRLAVSDELSDIAAELEGDIVLRIQQGPKTGRIYKRGGVTHQASASGQSPANDTGTLMRSIYSEKLTSLSYVVGSRIAYAAYLEYGTRRMAARPFFRPPVEEMRKEFNSRLEAAINRAIP